MNSRDTSRIAAATLLLFLGTGWEGRLAAGESLRVETAAATSEWILYHGSQKVLVYAFPPTRFKPCVTQIFRYTTCVRVP